MLRRRIAGKRSFGWRRLIFGVGLGLGAVTFGGRMFGGSLSKRPGRWWRTIWGTPGSMGSTAPTRTQDTAPLPIGSFSRSNRAAATATAVGSSVSGQGHDAFAGDSDPMEAQMHSPKDANPDRVQRHSPGEVDPDKLADILESERREPVGTTSPVSTVEDGDIKTVAMETLKENPSASYDEVLSAWRVHRGQAIDDEEVTRVAAIYGRLTEAADAA